jgi:hypothetical protein
VLYCYTVTNTGDVALYNVTLVDDPLGPIDLGTTTLAPGESTNGTLTYVAADAGKQTNTATATGTSLVGGNVTDTDDYTIWVGISLTVRLR